MDLVAVARLEQIEEMPDEVVDLHDGVVAEPWHRDGGAGVIVGPMCALGGGPANRCLCAGPAGSFGAPSSGPRMALMGRQRLFGSSDS